MVGQAHIRDVERINTDSRAVEDEVYLALWGMARMGWGVGDIGVSEAGCGEKQIKLTAAPEGVEITSNDYILADIADQGMELFKLVLSVPVFQGKMDDENGHRQEVSLQDQAFHALLKIVKMKVLDGLFGQEGIALLPENRHFLGY